MLKNKTFESLKFFYNPVVILLVDVRRVDLRVLTLMYDIDKYRDRTEERYILNF